MRYTSRGWDFGCFMARSDGLVDRWLCDPYTFRFHKSPGHDAIRWLVRQVTSGPQSQVDKLPTSLHVVWGTEWVDSIHSLPKGKNNEHH